LGGPVSLWGGTETLPAAATLLGRYTPGVVSAGHLWSTDIYSYNYKDGSYTTYDGGSYKGYLTGTLVGDAGAARFLGLYIHEDAGQAGVYNAGVLRGSLAGGYYPEVGMFALDGGMYPEAPVVVSIGIEPGQLVNVAAATGDVGNKLLRGRLGASGSVWAEVATLETLSIVKPAIPEVPEVSPAVPAEPLNWGIYRQGFAGRYEGTGSTWSGKAGGAGAFGLSLQPGGIIAADTGYWYGEIPDDSTWSDGGFSAQLTKGRFITYRRIGGFGTGGYLIGDLYGVYEPVGHTWQGYGLGTWQGEPLAFSSNLQGRKYRLVSMPETPSYLEYSTFDGIMGSNVNLWAKLGTNEPTPLFMMGNAGFTPPGSDPSSFNIWSMGFASFDPAVNMNPYYDSGGSSKSPVVDGKFGAYAGFLGGVLNGSSGIKGMAQALYMDQSGNVGLLYQDDTIVAESELYASLNLWQAAGALYAYQMYDASKVDPAIDVVNFASRVTGQEYQRIYTPELEAEFVAGDPGSTISLGADVSRGLSFSGAAPGAVSWGIDHIVAGGAYTGNPTAWTWIMNPPPPEMTPFMDTTFINVKLAETTNNVFTGGLAGANIHWQDAGTSVFGGRIKGVFDPVASTWKAVTLATRMETGAFLDKVNAMGNDDAQRLAFQKATNIPSFQVGQATLDSNGLQAINGGAMSVTMSNVTFFSASTGGPASIWASAPNSGGVTGSYTGTPVPGSGSVVNLTQTAGSNVTDLTAAFQLNNWNAEAAKWGAAVNGGGNVNSQSITFTGGAAGKILTAPNGSPGTFSGSAAGIVTPPKPAK